MQFFIKKNIMKSVFLKLLSFRSKDLIYFLINFRIKFKFGVGERGFCKVFYWWWFDFWLNELFLRIDLISFELWFIRRCYEMVDFLRVKKWIGFSVFVLICWRCFRFEFFVRECGFSELIFLHGGLREMSI